MALGIFDLVGVIMLVLAGTSLVYLLRVGNKSRSTWMLLWFFLCVVLSSLSTIVANSGTAWDWAFAPAQDAMLLLGGVFLVRFAYFFPERDQPRETCWVVTFFAVLALAALTYAVSFAIRYIANLPGDLDENQVYYLLTPVYIGLAVIVFFRRSIHWSAQALQLNETGIQPRKSSLMLLLKPRNRPAFALRSYGLSLAIALVPVVVVVTKTALPGVLASALFNFGAVIAIAALMLTYFNYTPEPVTISAKLVGISLVSVLLILGLAGVGLYETNPGIDVHSLVSTLIILVLSSSLLIILIFPFFFRAALLDPLDRLSEGVRNANEGDLNVQVAVQYEDEIGFLTQSFNNMIRALNEATQEIKNESVILERQVAERTTELRESNQQLTKENAERKEAQAILDRQLRYEQALAACSQSLLLTADSEEKQQLVLTEALENLRSGVCASRAYVLRNFQDNSFGLCTGIKAEACAEEIPPHINNPVNQKFQWSLLPKEMYAVLSAGHPHGGPVELIFASTPALLDAFLHQTRPLLSVLTLPIFFGDQWWGLIGLDDCETAREWDQDETLLLRTASEIIASALQRWEVEIRLRDTLENLEQRVYSRTVELAQANVELRHEIHERQRFQDGLEERLEVEKKLANISTRLLSPLELREAINETLADLGTILQASNVIFIELPNSSINLLETPIEWQAPAALPLSGYVVQDLNASYNWLSSVLDRNKSIYIDNLSTHPGVSQPGQVLFLSAQVDAMLLTPLILENHLAGVLLCINPKLHKSKILENTQLVEVISSLFSSLLRREALLNSLEEKVAERTRELSAFFDLAVLAGQAQELSDIMQPALVKVMEISASDAAVIHVFDEDQRVMRIVAQRGFQSKTLSKLKAIRLDDPTMAWVIGRSGEVWYSDTSRHPDAFELPQFKSDTHLPLRARGKVQGLLSCYRISQIPFNPYQVFFLNTIGEQLGLAVENHRLRLETEEFATIQERQRLARELHDAVSQSLYSLTLIARSGRDAYDRGDRLKLLDSLELLEVNSLAALKEMRLLLYQLRSLALEEGGIVQAIEARFGLVEKRSGIQASFHTSGNIELAPGAEQELFRLVIEALNNSLKHSGASQVTVGLEADDDQIVLTVADNGRGFDPQQASAGMGLQNMRQRASALGGRINITSQPGRGVRLRVEIPRLLAVKGEG